MASRAHRIRIYPNKEQEEKLARTCEVARAVYNWALEKWQEWYQEYKDGEVETKPSAFGLSKRWTKERPEWTKEVSYKAQQHAIIDVGAAYTNFWRKLTGPPKFKKKGKCRDSFYMCNSDRHLYGNKIHIDKVGRIRMSELPRFEGKIMSYVVSREADQWYVSINYDNVPIEHKLTDSTCGVDVGMKTPAVCSDGIKLVLPQKLKRLERRKRKAQKKMNRRRKGSNRRRKALRRVQRIQLEINNIRVDAIHKFTSAVCKNHDTVVIEDLTLTGLHQVPIKHIRSGMVRSCMYEVRRQLEYKAYHLVKADRWYPSTQICSKCGARQKLKLTQRTYSCPHCGLSLDRDLNAALNLSHYPGSPG